LQSEKVPLHQHAFISVVGHGHCAQRAFSASATETALATGSFRGVQYSIDMTLELFVQTVQTNLKREQIDG
jgi:hypothetical protein